MYYIKINNISHLVFAEILTTNQLIELTEKLLDTTVIDYTVKGASIKCITNNYQEVAVEVTYVNSFSIPNHVEDEIYLKELQNNLDFESLEETLHYIISTR